MGFSLHKWLLLIFILAQTPSYALEKGDKALAFSLPNLQTQQITKLDKFKGKVIYLDFWASWCAPCQTSFPLLDKLHNKLKTKGFAVVGINLDEEKADAEKFFSQFPVSFTLLRDNDGQYADQYGVETMPIAFIIDRKGVIMKVHNGFSKYDIEELEQLIIALLDKP